VKSLLTCVLDFDHLKLLKIKVKLMFLFQIISIALNSIAIARKKCVI